MNLHVKSRRSRAETKEPGRSPLVLARAIIALETLARYFGLPLALAGLFIAAAWLGFFAALHPLAHLGALAAFVAAFFAFLGQACAAYRPPPEGRAQRRVEEANGLAHRPFDTIKDRPVAMDEPQNLLWQEHIARARNQLTRLRWPRWTLRLAGYDPFGLRFALLLLLAAGLAFGWGSTGARLTAALDPQLGKLRLAPPALDVRITPPDYTHLPPIVLATPAGLLHQHETLEVPEGSEVDVRWPAAANGPSPVLHVGQGTFELRPRADGGDLEASRAVTDGVEIAVRRGWQNLGSWPIRVVRDTPPHIRFSEPPSITERKSLRLSYEASDDYGVRTIALKITPRETVPGVEHASIALPLAEPDSANVRRADFADVTDSPWAGLPVQLQLIATDAAGHETASAPTDMTLPERAFFQPVAQALVEERKKLLQNPSDEGARNEAANVMAGIARQPAAFRGDPVVLMALRGGAVRLVLDRSREALAPVVNILWQAAVRVEDGAAGLAEENVRQAAKDLADALDRGTDERDILQKTDRLQQAIAQYMAELSARAERRPGPPEDFGGLMSPQQGMLTPDDLDQMLNAIRGLSATGAKDAARHQLARLQNVLENLKAGQPRLTPEQRAGLERLKGLRELTRDQRALLDRTFQAASSGGKGRMEPFGALAGDQNNLLRRLRDIKSGAARSDTPEGIDDADDAMERAASDLRSGAANPAMDAQNEALKALQKAESSLIDELRQSLFMLPGPGMGANGSDPFGRGLGRLFSDPDNRFVPNRIETRRVQEILNELQRRAGDGGRPKIERDYIERLLRNF